ncbi:MAG: CPBP family intramembrane metalloprotease [Alphaproteobacteria bacterium]|nr:CPBP family intramembrane metalloprotease [Alphaproteobacteria bacterium]
MNLLGEDFARALTGWLYPAEPLQRFWRSFGFFVLLFVISVLLQSVFALIVFRAGFPAEFATLVQTIQQSWKSGGGMMVQPGDPTQAIAFVKASLIGMFPAAIITALLALWLAPFGMAKRGGHLPMAWPKLGPLGWASVVVSFVVIMNVVAAILFSAMGVDPSKELGLVETGMAAMAKDPLMFDMVLPSTIIGAPVMEEILFRGALFAGLVQSPVGRPGAVLITAALWAAAHGGAAPVSYLVVLFTMGLVLGLLLLRFGSLWVTIACHTAWNTLASLAVVFAGTQT